MPPLVSVQAFLRVSAQAGQGRVGPWAPAPGRWVAGRGVGPPAGRRPCGQLCCVGASSLALCSVKALSQTAPLFSCWDCWEVGRPDSGRGSNTGCWGCSGSVSMPLHSRPEIKAELGAGPSSAGQAGSRHPHPGPGVLPGQGAMLGHACFPGQPGRAAAPSSMALLCPPSSLFLPLCLCRLPALSPWSLSPSPRRLSLFLSSLRHPGASLLASVPLPWWPPPLGAPSSLSWPGLHVPVSPGACVWVAMGVSLEKSLSASSLQLQAGCHGNRVRGPPLQQLSCGLGEGWGPAGQRVPQGPKSPW